MPLLRVMNDFTKELWKSPGYVLKNTKRRDSLLAVLHRHDSEFLHATGKLSNVEAGLEQRLQRPGRSPACLCTGLSVPSVLDIVYFNSKA